MYSRLMNRLRDPTVLHQSLETEPDSTQFSGPQESREEDLSKYFQGDDDTVSVKWYDDKGYPHERKDLDKQGLETLKGELNTPQKPRFFQEFVELTPKEHVVPEGHFFVVDRYDIQEGPYLWSEAIEVRKGVQQMLIDQGKTEDAKQIRVRAA